MRIQSLLLGGVACAFAALAQERAPLRLVTTIPLPQASGRFDHSSVDLEGQRLFIALRDGNTVEVIDLRNGRSVQSMRGFAQPSGVYYVPLARRLFVTSAGDGTCKVISGDSLEVVGTIQLSQGANVIAHDPVTGHLYVGHGGRQVGDTATDKRDPGQIAVIDAASGKQVGNIQTDAELRPGAIVVERSGPRLFTTNALGSQVVVIDRKKRAVLSKWTVPNVERSGSLALDEARRRLFVGTRNPALVIVFDADSGKPITSFPTVEGIDRLLYDANSERLYATGSPKATANAGSIEAYGKVGPDRYELIARIPTGPGGGTSLLVRQTGRLYVALPRDKERDAEMRVYETRS